MWGYGRLDDLASGTAGIFNTRFFKKKKVMAPLEGFDFIKFLGFQGELEQRPPLKVYF